MIKLYYICSLKSSIFLNFFKLDNQFFCRALKYIILRRKKLDKIILYKFYLILINLIYLLLITELINKIIVESLLNVSKTMAIDILNIIISNNTLIQSGTGKNTYYKLR